MSDRDRLKDWLLSAGFVPNTSVSVFDLKPGEFMEPPEEYVRDSDDHSIMFGDGHGYRGTYFTLDFDEAGKYTGTQFLGVGVKKPEDAESPLGLTRPGWQPIATAPKDGTYVLLCDGMNVFIGQVTFHSEKDGITYYLDENRNPIEPTHWHPLPAPPGDAC